MKKTILYALAASVLVLSSCDDMLDKSPRDRFENNPAFWSNSNQVSSYCNKFYDDYSGYGTGAGAGWFYFKSLSDDQVNPDFDNWSYTSTVSNSSDWSSPATEIRRATFVIQNMANSSLSASERAHYTAIARLNRAWQYYLMVRQYGDVEWIDHVVNDTNDPFVYGTRTDRDVVMDSVVADLDYAADNLGTTSDKTQFSKFVALAMKSDICLYEGTYCKYRTAADNGKAADPARATRYLQLSQAASEAIINSGNYSLSANYGDIYNSLNLGASSEIIWYRNYEKDVAMHGLCDWTSGSTAQRGITKDAVDAFLFLDGKPLATTTLPTDDKAVLNAKGDYSIQHLLANKDKRLSVLVDSIVCFKGHGWARLDESGNSTGQAQMTSPTGYTIKKYDNTSLELYYRSMTNTSYTDAPLYWYAVTLLNEAEAKAELGTLTQADLDATVNLLQARAGLPGLTLNPAADPANNMGVSNLLWEIRRVRRCELMTDNWYRYWDLVRWHQLDKLDSNQHPNINRGANLSNVPNCESSLDADGYMIGSPATRAFANKYYFYPIPTSELTLNDQISQNPGW